VSAATHAAAHVLADKADAPAVGLMRQHSAALGSVHAPTFTACSPYSPLPTRYLDPAAAEPPKAYLRDILVKQGPKAFAAAVRKHKGALIMVRDGSAAPASCVQAEGVQPCSRQSALSTCQCTKPLTVPH